MGHFMTLKSGQSLRNYSVVADLKFLSPASIRYKTMNASLETEFCHATSIALHKTLYSIPFQDNRHAIESIIKCYLLSLLLLPM